MILQAMMSTSCSKANCLRVSRFSFRGRSFSLIVIVRLRCHACQYPLRWILTLVLEHPELPLILPNWLQWTKVQHRNISYATQTTEGTNGWDTFMCLVATTRKLGISFFEYMSDRISETGIIPSVATIIWEESFLNTLGYSWQSK